MSGGLAPCAKASPMASAVSSGTAVPIETTSAPPALRSERRETEKCVALSILVMIAPSTHHRRCALDRAQDAHVGAAAALEAGERVLDLRLGRLLVLIEERGRGHDPAIDAIAALRHLLLDIGLLDRVRLFRRAEARQGDDLAVPDRRHRGHAGAYGLAVDVHRAGAALRQTAAEMRVVERELVAQRIEQRHV